MSQAEEGEVYHPYSLIVTLIWVLQECCWPDSTAARRNHTNQGDDPPRMPDSRLEPALYSLQGYDEVQGPMWDGPAADLNGIFGSVVTGEHTV